MEQAKADRGIDGFTGECGIQRPEVRGLKDMDNEKDEHGGCGMSWKFFRPAGLSIAMAFG